MLLFLWFLTMQYPRYDVRLTVKQIQTIDYMQGFMVTSLNKPYILAKLNLDRAF